MHNIEPDLHRRGPVPRMNADQQRVLTVRLRMLDETPGVAQALDPALEAMGELVLAFGRIASTNSLAPDSLASAVGAR